jgi:hypothetical protein
MSMMRQLYAKATGQHYCPQCKRITPYTSILARVGGGWPAPYIPHLDSVHPAMDEVNKTRADRRLYAFKEDLLLTQAAIDAAVYRARRRIAGHTDNDFSFVPKGTIAKAAGCAALEPSWGWGACCTYERKWTFAGAAVAMGDDGLRYMHLFVR